MPMAAPQARLVTYFPLKYVDLWLIDEGMMAEYGAFDPMSHFRICFWQAFVEFANEETAARAMQLHREPMGSVSWLLTI